MPGLCAEASLPRVLSLVYAQRPLPKVIPWFKPVYASLPKVIPVIPELFPLFLEFATLTVYPGLRRVSEKRVKTVLNIA